jgi:hypothetical protein
LPPSLPRRGCSSATSSRRDVPRSGRSQSPRVAVLLLAPAGRDAPWGGLSSPRVGSPRVAATSRERERSSKNLVQPWNWRTHAASGRQRWRRRYNKRSNMNVCFFLVGTHRRGACLARRDLRSTCGPHQKQSCLCAIVHSVQPSFTFSCSCTPFARLKPHQPALAPAVHGITLTGVKSWNQLCAWTNPVSR